MEKRKNLVYKFSSFISFTDNNPQMKFVWKVDLELEKNMKLEVESDPNTQESFWTQYFLKLLLLPDKSSNRQNENIFRVERHLSAYLQEACLKAAKDIYHEFKYIKHKYSLEEYFQIANIAAISPRKFLRNFNFEYNQVNIEAYAITAFKRFIRNQVYQQDLEARRTKFSNYGLLRNLNARELNEALLAQNFSEQQNILYRLAWQCFNEIFQPKSNRLSRTRTPSQSDFTTIASYYNQRCEQLHFFNVTATDITIQEMLLTCIKAARNYRNRQYCTFEEDYYSISDSAPSTWDILIQQEEWQQVQVIVDKLFINMPELCQIIFKLWQGLNLTQTEIATVLKSQYPELQKQYQVARHLQRYTRSILKEFAEQWNKSNSEICLNHEKDIAKLKSALEKCLQVYCQQLVFSTLDLIFQQVSVGEKKIVYDFNQSLNLISPIKLTELLQQQLEQTMCLSTNSLLEVNHKLVDIVNEWIKIKQDIYEGESNNVE